MSLDLDGKVVVITGAAGGIGLGLARAAAARGMRVVLSDVDAGRAEHAANGLRADGADVIAHACDVRHLGEVEALRDAAVDAMGSVEVWCNNAGIGLARPLTECTDAEWRLVLGIDLMGVVNGVQTILPHFVEQGSGHLSATASLSGLIGDPDLAIYSAAKFGVVGLMESLAQEMRRDHPGITASVLCPGPVATDLIVTSAKALVDGGASGGAFDDAVGEYLARGMHPDEVGRLAVDGIAAGDFWLLPHPDLTFELLDQRHASMRSRQLATADDQWTDQ